MAKTQFEMDLEKRIEEQKGVFFPIKASFPERMMVREIAPDRLYPNAADEFCVEGIGPSYRIISEYEKSIKDALEKQLPPLEEPIMVEKLHPKGYLILNGHHRWAAALRLGVKKIPIQIINLAQETDIKAVLEQSAHDKRVVFDLEEVIFRSPDDPNVEPKKYPSGIFFKERIRLGVAALFYFLEKEGYDVWVYSSSYCSVDDVRKFFKCYSTHITGAVTAVGQHGVDTKRFQTLFANTYRSALHIDNDSILLTNKGQKDFQSFALERGSEQWSGEIMDIVKGLRGNEEQNG